MNNMEKMKKFEIDDNNMENVVIGSHNGNGG
jgi:hypothetical protein